MSTSDPNRAPRVGYTPGDPRPRVLTVATVLLALGVVLIISSGLFLVFPPVPDSVGSQQLQDMHSVLQNMRIAGGIEIVFGIILAICIPGLWQGRARSRFIALCAGVIAILMCLLCYALSLAGPAQLINATFISLGVLLSYQPSLKEYFQ